MEDSLNPALLPCLELAVTIEIDHLKQIPWAQVVKLGRAQADVIASKGDMILYRSKKQGETAKAFASLAKAVAVVTFLPGGVKVFGLTFKAEHPGATS